MIQQFFVLVVIAWGLLFPTRLKQTVLVPSFVASGETQLKAQAALPQIPKRPEPPAMRPATEWPEISSKAALVMDRASGAILWQKDAEAVHPIASLTKLMTAMVVLDREPTWDATYAMRADENQLIGAKLRLGEGESVRIVDLFFASLVGSTNNATLALARSTGLSDEAFVEAMNAKAAKLRLTTMRFVDPTGLEPENVATARDLAMMARAAFSYAKIREATTRPNHEMRTVNTDIYHNLRSTNLLLNGDLDITGSKTGYLDEAGYCLISQVRVAEGRELLVIILGAATHHQRFTETRALIDWAVASFDFG